MRVNEEPADMCLREALQRAAEAAVVPYVRAVGIALLVGVAVVLAMVGYPREYRPLDRDRAEDGEQAVQPAVGLEAAVGEVAMEPDGHAQPGEHVHDQEHRDVAPAQQIGPDLPADDAQRDERQGGDRSGGDAVRGLVDDGLDLAWIRPPLIVRP